MNLVIPYSFSFKRKLFLKRLQQRKIEIYKNKVNQILANGKTEFSGILFNSIADLTSEFYKN